MSCLFYAFDFAQPQVACINNLFRQEWQSDKIRKLLIKKHKSV